SIFLAGGQSQAWHTAEEKGLHFAIKEYSEVVLKEMLTHDVSFLNRELQIEMSKIADLESRLNLLPGDPSVTSKRLGPKRTVFVGSVEEARDVKSSLESTVPTRVCVKLKNDDVEEFMSLQESGYRELSERLNRAEKLKLAIQKRTAKSHVLVCNPSFVFVFFCAPLVLYILRKVTKSNSSV
ncbi:unnamed protein product, partial [Dibothriocephalus latus]